MYGKVASASLMVIGKLYDRTSSKKRGKLLLKKRALYLWTTKKDASLSISISHLFLHFFNWFGPRSSEKLWKCNHHCEKFEFTPTFFYRTGKEPKYLQKKTSHLNVPSSHLISHPVTISSPKLTKFEWLVQKHTVAVRTTRKRLLMWIGAQSKIEQH